MSPRLDDAIIPSGCSGAKTPNCSWRFTMSTRGEKVTLDVSLPTKTQRPHNTVTLQLRCSTSCRYCIAPFITSYQQPASLPKTLTPQRNNRRQIPNLLHQTPQCQNVNTRTKHPTSIPRRTALRQEALRRSRPRIAPLRRWGPARTRALWASAPAPEGPTWWRRSTAAWSRPPLREAGEGKGTLRPEGDTGA